MNVLFFTKERFRICAFTSIKVTTTTSIYLVYHLQSSSTFISVFHTSKDFSVSSNSCAAREGKCLSQCVMLASSSLSRMSMPLGHGIKGIYLLFPTLFIIPNLQWIQDRKQLLKGLLVVQVERVTPLAKNKYDAVVFESTFPPGVVGRRSYRQVLSPLQIDG